MADPNEDSVLGYRTDRTVFTHSILFGVAESALASALEARKEAQKSGVGPPPGSDLITSWVMAAFAMEAYLNFAGERLLTYWDDIERIGVRQKFSVLVKHVNFSPDFGDRPYQTLRRMWKNRDLLAHARTVTPRSIVNDGPSPTDVPYPKADWEKDLSLAATERLLEDVKAVHLDLHKRFGFQDGSFGRTESRGGQILRRRSPGPTVAGAAMLNYVASFEVEDRERVFRFLALFARWEYALKRTNGFVRPGPNDQAEADWNAYAKAVEPPLAALSAPSFVAARDALLANPPARQHFDGANICWQSNPKRKNEGDAVYLLRVVRDVRNNLFHGGKYQEGPVQESARDRELIDRATTVLEACVDLEPRTRAVFDEAVQQGTEAGEG